MTTAIRKSPLDGRRITRKLDIDGAAGDVLVFCCQSNGGVTLDLYVE